MSLMMHELCVKQVCEALSKVYCYVCLLPKVSKFYFVSHDDCCWSYIEAKPESLGDLDTDTYYATMQGSTPLNHRNVNLRLIRKSQAVYLFFIVTVIYQRKGSALFIYRAKRKSLLAYTQSLTSHLDQGSHIQQGRIYFILNSLLPL